MSIHKVNAETDSILKVFFYYSIPAIIGLVSIASGSIIDGSFVGKYVGAHGLAAINLTIPLSAFIFGVAIMLSIGGSVQAGKLIGSHNTKDASQIFTKNIISLLVISTLLSVTFIIFSDIVVRLLGANDEIAPWVSIYLTNIYPFFPLALTGIGLSSFVRIVGKPGLSSRAMTATAVINIALDYLFVVQWGMGLRGAAIATGIAFASLFFILIPVFIRSNSELKIVKPKGSWKSVIEAATNGLSEFLNETSVGIITLVFNYIILDRLGISGIAAFTVINYIMFIGIMICYGTSDSIHSIVSINFGAKQSDRINAFLRLAGIFNLSVGLIIIILMNFSPDMLIDLFLKEADQSAKEIAFTYVSYIWPAFLFNGINLIISSYFTAMHKPYRSAAIALSRSLVLPILMVLLLSFVFGEIGIYIATPVAEFITIIFAIIIFIQNSPKKLIEREDLAISKKNID